MSEVRLYYQERADGGQRSGVYVDGAATLSTFLPGTGEPDPSLHWYIDLVWETDTVPETEEDARAWLSTHADDIRDVINRAADDLVGGIDVDLTPWSHAYATTHGQVQLSVSAMRRFSGIDVARRLRDLAATWEKLYPRLARVG